MSSVPLGYVLLLPDSDCVPAQRAVLGLDLALQLPAVGLQATLTLP